MTPKAHNQNRNPAQAALAEHYRAIGPAAVLAALMFVPRGRVRHGRSVRSAI